MKLSNAVLLLASFATTAVNAKRVIKSNKAAAKVLRNAQRVRKAEEDEEEEEDEFAYLGNYNLKMVSCLAGEQVQNAEDGEYEYSAVLVRLCPSEYGCDNEEQLGCSSSHGDFVVGINTFVDAYFEDQRENMENNGDDDFDLNEFSECREYEPENDDDGDADDEDEWYVGPTCTEDGLDIKLALFENYKCNEVSETAFEDISNGWSLPYNDGGVVSNYCQECMEYNDDGEYELREFCQQTYEEAAYKCEENMEYYSYYGQNNQGCEVISEMIPAKKGSGNGGRIFGWIVFLAVVAGLAGYVMWWRKKKQSGATTDGIMS